LETRPHRRGQRRRWRRNAHSPDPARADEITPGKQIKFNPHERPSETEVAFVFQLPKNFCALLFRHANVLERNPQPAFTDRRYNSPHLPTHARVAGTKSTGQNMNYESAKRFALVFDLYDLTPAEIKIVEESSH